MLKNHNHDLVQQLSETADSIWRIDEYIKNAKGCDHCKALWKDVRNHLEKVSLMVVAEIGRHVKENRFE